LASLSSYPEKEMMMRKLILTALVAATAMPLGAMPAAAAQPRGSKESQ
jgi:hypothetical protein